MIRNPIIIGGAKAEPLTPATNYLESFLELAVSNGTLTVALTHDVDKLLTMHVAGYTSQSNLDSGYASGTAFIYTNDFGLRYESWAPKTTSLLTNGVGPAANKVTISGNQVSIEVEDLLELSVMFVDVIICYQVLGTTEVEQATPSISVSSAGLITASSVQAAGYVSAGTKSATKQLTTQAAKTVTPTTAAQTAVAAGAYTTGAVTVAPGMALTESGTVASAVTLAAGATTKIPLSGSFSSPGSVMVRIFSDTSYTLFWRLCGVTDGHNVYIYNDSSSPMYAKSGDPVYQLG